MPQAVKVIQQLVVFGLQTREYALPVESVSEILRMVALTPFPQATPWLPGLINLRGRVIPVMDVRLRLGLPAAAPNLNTPIIVAVVEGRAVGLIVDSVLEVISLAAESFESPDKLTGSTHPVSNIARIDGRLVLILDLNRIGIGLEAQGWETINNAAQTDSA